MNLGLETAQCEIDRIPEQAVAGTGTANEVARDVKPRQNAMQPGQQQIGQQHPEHNEQQHWPAGMDARTKHQVGQPNRRQAGEGEEHPVHYVHH